MTFEESERTITPGESERRRSPRETVPDNRIRVGWADERGNHRVWGRLIDISRHGARIATEGPPKVGSWIWFRMDLPVAMPWVWARVRRRSGPEEAGVEFAGICQIDLLLAATLGITPFGSPGSSGDPGASDIGLAW